MVDIEFIRKQHFVKGWSIRKISRHLQIARQTVRKALQTTEIPRYKLTRPRPCPVMDRYAPVIEAWLVADETAPPRQRHTAHRIYERLVAEFGFTGGESTVRQFVRKLRNEHPAVFIPLEAGYGEQAQVDWGQAKVILGGVPTLVHLFCLRLRKSKVTFAWASPTEKLEAFLEGHVRAFSWLGGVPAQCVYDNLKTAVVKILAGPERQEHQFFASLRSHYLFDSLFCNPESGHEKGSVENGVGYVRRNALVPVAEFPDWSTLNKHLQEWCEKDRARLAGEWTREAAALRPLPDRPFRSALTRLVPVNRLSLVHFDRNRYSVPCRYVSQSLRLDAFTDRVELWDGNQQVAVHPRYHGRGETVVTLDHYLPALAEKPRAVTHALVVRRLPPVYSAVREQLCRRHPQGYRDFAAILMLHQEFAAEQIASALQEALDRQCVEPLVIRQILLGRTSPLPPEKAMVPATLAEAKIAPADPSRYDALLGRRVS